MSFLAENQGVLRPEDLSIIRNVYDRVVSGPWVTADPRTREQFAAFVVKSYQRGMCHPDKLLQFCQVAARQQLATEPFNGAADQTDPDQ